jgi:hypothetical protein
VGLGPAIDDAWDSFMKKSHVLNKNASALSLDEILPMWPDCSIYASTGMQPSVALVHLDGHLYVIEVHRTSLFKECFSRVGEVETEGVKENRELNINLQSYSVVKLKISATNNGTLVIVHEEAYTRKRMRYHFGRLERRMEGDQKRLYLNELHTTLSTVYGVEPDRATSENTAVVLFRSGLINQLSYCTGVNPMTPSSIPRRHWNQPEHQYKPIWLSCVSISDKDREASIPHLWPH